MSSLNQHLQSFPPYICRLLSRLSNRELSKRSGLSLRTVIRISQKRDWNSVTIKAADSYMSACGINPLCLWRQRFRLKRMLTSKNGLYGTKGLRLSKKLPIWKKGNRAVMMRSIMKAILEE